MKQFANIQQLAKYTTANMKFFNQSHGHDHYTCKSKPNEVRTYTREASLVFSKDVRKDSAQSKAARTWSCRCHKRLFE